VTWARWTTTVLLMLLAAMYVAAKVHFFTRFYALPLEAYWAEHWPLTAALAVAAGLLWLVGYVAERRARRGAK
jgi:hypothetical protein